MSLLDCNVPAGFEIHFDLSSLSKASRTKIRKWLTQGYTQISTGSNRSIYEYFARLADLPIAGVGQGHRSWYQMTKDQLKALSDETKTAALVIERMAPLRYPKVNGKVPESVWSYNKEEKATVKGMIEQIMSDPVMRERRQKALEQFDKAEKIVRKSGG